MSNQKQLALATIMYSQDYDEQMMLPYYNTYWYWPSLLFPYVKNTQVYNCPSDTGPNHFTNANTWDRNVSYGYSSILRAGLPSGVQTPYLSAIAQPSATVLFADTGNGHWQSTPGTSVDAPAYRHLDTAVVAFCDGHAKAMQKSVLEEVTTTGEDGIAQANLWKYGGSYIWWNRS